MKKLTFILLLTFNISIWAQGNTQTYNGLNGWTEKQTISKKDNLQNRTVKPYDAIWIEGNFEVTLYKGEEGNIELSGPLKLLEEVKVENTSKGLRIKYSSHWKKMFYNPRTKKSVAVRIPFETLTRISLSGSGRIQTEDTLHCQRFLTHLAGSGKIKLALTSNQTEASLSGSGRIELQGNSHSLNSRLAGSGTIDCKNLVAQNSDASLSGSGQIYLHSVQSIHSSVAGSGNVSVYGNPPKVSSKSAGSGKTNLIER